MQAAWGPAASLGCRVVRCTYIYMYVPLCTTPPLSPSQKPTTRPKFEPETTAPEHVLMSLIPTESPKQPPPTEKAHSHQNNGHHGMVGSHAPGYCGCTPSTVSGTPPAAPAEGPHHQRMTSPPQQQACKLARNSVRQQCAPAAHCTQLSRPQPPQNATDTALQKK